MDHAQTATTGPIARPLEVEAGVRVVKVGAVVPCFNRPGDLEVLAGDLGRCELEVEVPGGGARGMGERVRGRTPVIETT